jgi:putative effector of murein hydrolase
VAHGDAGRLRRRRPDFGRLGRHPVANPVALAAALLGALLVATRTPDADYFDGAPFVHFLLGPATVALAVLLWRARARVRRSLLRWSRRSSPDR